MNLDLITKLAKLANNNPNDNEANLAARRACKLIEEGKFQFGVNTSKPTTKPPTVNQQKAYDPMDIFRQYAYGQQARYEPRYKCKNCGAALDYLDSLSSSYCDRCRKTKEKQEQAKKKDNESSRWEYVYYNEPIPKAKYNPPGNVTVKCLFCKQDFKRKEFRSDFICHQCYVKKNKSEKPPIKDDTTKTYYKAVFCFECGHTFTVTYTDLDNNLTNTLHGNCETCKAPYIRTK